MGRDVDSYEFKPLTGAGIENAIAKAHHYRLLNEPGVSESICRDVLLADEGNAEATKILLLSLTDMFERGIRERFEEAVALARALPDDYAQAYYLGIVYERRAKAHHRQRTPACGQMAHEWLEKAMAQFEIAEKLRPEGNDDALLRWNNCVRRLRAHPDICPGDEAEDIVPQLGE